MDALSEVLANSRAERVTPAHFSFQGPWSFRSDGLRGLLIRASRGESYWIECAGQPPVHVNAGDLVILAPNVAHTIASDPKLKSKPFLHYSKHWRGKLDLAKLDVGGAGKETEIVTMLVWFSAYFRHSILGFIPPLLVLRRENMRLSQGLHELLNTAIPLMFDRPSGWGVSRLRLAELAVVNILGDHFSVKSALQMTDGWLRGLTDPAIAKAIARIHRQPNRDWTNEELAQEAAMSRSRFSLKFRSLVGLAPIEYLTAYRMILAADRMEGVKPDISDIAKEIGYKTEKGFIRAFVRWSGSTPAAYMRRKANHVGAEA